MPGLILTKCNSLTTIVNASSVGTTYQSTEYVIMFASALTDVGTVLLNVRGISGILKTDVSLNR